MTSRNTVDRKLTSNQETSTTMATKTKHCTRFSGAGPISGWHSWQVIKKSELLEKPAATWWCWDGHWGGKWEHQPFEGIDRDYVVLTESETLKQIQVNLANHGCKNHPQMPGMFFLYYL